MDLHLLQMQRPAEMTQSIMWPIGEPSGAAGREEETIARPPIPRLRLREASRDDGPICLNRPEEVVHQIHGTGVSFSSNPDDLDENAVEALRKITKAIDDGLEVQTTNDAIDTDPQDLPKGFFLSNAKQEDSFRWTILINPHINLHNKHDAGWRTYSSIFGYSIGHHASGYKGIKRTYVYHEGNSNTNWIMNVYRLIRKNAYIKTDDVALCHVFQSDNYDPMPKRVPDIFDFNNAPLISRVEELEGLMNNPKSFKDFDEFDGTYSKCDSKRKANGRSRKRAGVWEHFTEIEVLGPDGQVMLTLAICHGCSMAYQTGKWDSETKKLSNYGTKTLNEHHHKCSAQHHIAGNPQEAAHHQIP